MRFQARRKDLVTVVCIYSRVGVLLACIVLLIYIYIIY